MIANKSAPARPLSAFKKIALSFLVLAILLCPVRNTFAQGLYIVTDLGTLGGSSSGATAINDNGQIVGSSVDNYGDSQAFLYSAGQMTALISILRNNIAQSAALGISPNGQSVGSINTGSDVPVLFSGGGYTDLRSPPSHYPIGDAHGVNNSGIIVGSAYDNNTGGMQAFFYSGGAITEIVNAGWAGSSANAINSSGQIVGVNGSSAFYYYNGIVTSLAGGSALAINDNGQIVGQNSSGHACIFTGGTTIDLGTLGGSSSQASGINLAGQIVGYSTISNGSSCAFLYTSGPMTNLNNLLVSSNSSWNLQYANGINDNGQIVGQGINPSGQLHGYLLTPAGGLPPTITSITPSTTVSTGGSETLMVGLTGTPPFIYQWKLNGTAITNATNATLTITNFSPANIGSYTVTVSNAVKSVTSPPTTLASLDVKMFAGVIIDGPLGSNYLIQSTASLSSNWTTLTNIALPTQPYIYIDYSSPANRQQFYRAIPQ